MKGKTILDRFRQQEADTIALSTQLNQWSQVMIALLIREQESKLLASDLPVEPEKPATFWATLS